MSKMTAAFLAALLASLLAVGVPIAIYAFEAVLMWVAAHGVFSYATLMACIAYPFIYLMLRRMKP